MRKTPPANAAEIRGSGLTSRSGQEDPLEEGMAIHSSILAWRIQWTEEPGRLFHGQRSLAGYGPWSHWSDLAHIHATLQMRFFLTYSLFYPLLSEEKIAFLPFYTALNKLFCPSVTSSEIFITKVHAPAPYERSLKPCSPRPSSITALVRELSEYYLLVCGNLLKPCSF